MADAKEAKMGRLALGLAGRPCFLTTALDALPRFEDGSHENKP